VDFEWQGFDWIDCNDSDDSVLSFMRTGKNSDDLVVVVLNATPVVREGYIVGVPRAGYYKELLNTDAGAYGGSNVGNIGGQHAASDPRQGRPYSLCLTLPPLAAIFFKFTPA
jgi:1,4-alpha-glucan branching enzyme